MKLPPAEGARLAQRLIPSLAEVAPERAARLRDEEARRRDEELHGDESSPRPADEVLQRVRSRLA